MESSAVAMPGSATAASGARVAWTISGARIDPKKIPVLIAVALLVFAVAIVLFHSLPVALTAAVLLLASTIYPALPLTYVIDHRGVSVRIGSFTWLEMPWTNVRCVCSIPGGLKLSAFEYPAMARMDSRRGIRLRYSAAMATEVEGAVAAMRVQS